MKSIYIICISLFVSFLSGPVLQAQSQSFDMSGVAYEAFEYSITAINGSLPQDLGSMSLDRVSMTESSCDYYYTIKDNDVFTEYSNNQSQIKKNLYLQFDQNMASMETTLMFCIDAKISIVYHYRNRIGNEVTVRFSVSELKDILGKDITSTYRQDVLRRWLPVAFSAAAGSSMTYQGMTDNSIMYTLMLDNDMWDNDVVIDQDFLAGLVTEDFENKDPGRIFPLFCIYAEKGEDLTIVNSKTGARKNGFISFRELSNVYRATHSGYSSFRNSNIKEELYYGEESIPFQMVEIKPEFNGGDANAFSEWVNTQLVYPKEAKDNGVQGRVTLQFTVDVDGSVINVSVLRSVDPLLDAEALRVVKKSPRWTPGMHQGKRVRVTYTFPIIFALN